MSTLRVNTIQDASGGNASTPSEIRSGILRAWINYDGYGASIRASYNISSVTDNGTGDYTFFLDTDFADINYCWTGTATTATGTETTVRDIGFSTASSSATASAHLADRTRVSTCSTTNNSLLDSRQVMLQWIR